MSNLTQEPCKAENFRLYHSGLRNDISGSILELERIPGVRKM